MSIEPDPWFELDLAAVPRSIRAAGFAPTDMRVRVAGNALAPDHGRFRIRGWRSTYALHPASTEPAVVEFDAEVEFTGAEIRLRRTFETAAR